MRNDAKSVSTDDQRRQRRRMLSALMRKEWHEHRWRFFLGTIVLSGLLGGMLRAQLVPFNEAALMIYWPVGLIMVIFLAMGPVASEKSERTWEFLLAQPISRADILHAKWRVGLYQLLGMIAIATLVGLVAMWSRGFYGKISVFEDIYRHSIPNLGHESLSAAFGWLYGRPTIWMCLIVLTATVSLSCWYSVLFITLTRARNEFSAAMGGILLTIALHLWLIQLGELWFSRLRYITLLNPFSSFVVMLDPGFPIYVPLMLLGHVLLWIVLPLYLMRRFTRRAAKQ